MELNLNEFLIAISFALDFVEFDIVGSKTNHGKRVAYTSFRIGKALGFSKNELSDIVSLAILHDNGISEYRLNESVSINDDKKIPHFEAIEEHCIIGEKNVANYPFLNEHKNIIKYHHENYDGTGFFHIKGNEIPIMAQVIGFSDYIDNNYRLDNLYGNYKNMVVTEIKQQIGKIFSKDICEAFFEIINKANYRLDVRDDYIAQALKERLPVNSVNLTLNEICDITKVFSNIIDSKSKFTMRHSKGLAEKAAKMADYYNYDYKEKTKLVIAANLHDIGKLAIPNAILDCPRKLTADEFAIVECHTYYTRVALSQIKGFEDITEWASNHHEKLNGSGYPYGKSSKELDFNSRLMGCLDIYQALTEERPYRVGLSHQQTLKIMREMVSAGLIDRKIVDDIDYVFAEPNIR